MNYAFIAITAALAASSCATTPSVIIRSPELSTQNTVGVGDAMYTFERTAKVFSDINGTKEWGGWRQEVIYAGISKGQMKVAYREFVEDFARPAFYLDGQYDLEEGDSITFKGSKIKVLDANSQGVTYVVQQGFSGEDKREAYAKKCLSSPLPTAGCAKE